MALSVYLHATTRRCVPKTTPVCVSRSTREMESPVQVKTLHWSGSPPRSSLKKKNTIRNKQHSLIFIQTLLVINTAHISTHVLSPPVTNMCQFWNGGCSKNAKCSQKGEKVNCTCLKGYSGDGYVCSTVDPCVKEDNGGCNEHALCTMTGPVSRLFSYFRLVMCCLYIRLRSCYIYFIEYFTWDKNHQSGLTHASY